MTQQEEEQQQGKTLRNPIMQLYQYFIGGNESSLRTHLTRGAIGSFIIKITSTALTFLISVLLARILGAEEFGYYAYALAIVNLLAVPTKLGLPNLIVRQTAAYKVKEQWGLMRGLLVRANQAVLIISIMLIIVALLVAWKFSVQIPSLSLPVFCSALAMLPLLGLGALRGAALRGLNYIVLGQLPENVVRQAIFIFLVILFVATISIENINSSLVMWMQVIATFIGFILGAILLLQCFPKPAKKITAAYETGTWVKGALPLLMVGTLGVINSRTDIIMLGAFTNSEAVGIYQVVARGAELIIFSLFAINMTVSPIISRLYVNKEMKKLQQMVIASSWAIIVFSLPVALILIVFGSWILFNVFGPEFVSGATALSILSVGHLINASMGSVGFLLNMTGHERDSAKGMTIAALINIILNLVLIPQWGIEGAAAATAISLVVWNLILSVYVYKRLKIYPSIIGSYKGLMIKID